MRRLLAIIRCCCCCSPGLCTAGRRRRSWCRGSSSRTGPRTSRCPSSGRETVYTANTASKRRGVRRKGKRFGGCTGHKSAVTQPVSGSPTTAQLRALQQNVSYQGSVSEHIQKGMQEARQLALTCCWCIICLPVFKTWATRLDGLVLPVGTTCLINNKHQPQVKSDKKKTTSSVFWHAIFSNSRNCTSVSLQIPSQFLNKSRQKLAYLIATIIKILKNTKSWKDWWSYLLHTCLSVPVGAWRSPSCHSWGCTERGPRPSKYPSCSEWGCPVFSGRDPALRDGGR